MKKNNKKNKKNRKPIGFWTKEKCLEEAKKYSTRAEWSEKNRTSVVIANLKGWTNELTSHMLNKKKPPGYWTIERCIEESKKYTTKREWKTKSAGSYNAFLKNK